MALKEQNAETGIVSQSQLLSALAAAGDLVYEWSENSDALSWLGGDLLRAEAAELFGAKSRKTFESWINSSGLHHRADRLKRHLASKSPFFSCEYQLQLPSGKNVWIEERGAASFNAQGRAEKILATLRLITDRKLQEERMQKLAHYDELTGLFNAVYLREALDHALAFSKRHSNEGMFLVVGIDNLSLINNALGHSAADAVIVEVARRLQQQLSVSDIHGRLGGDHFGIVANLFAIRNEKQFLEDILASINATPIETEQGKVGVTVSIGVTHFPKDGSTAHDIMARAELALQAAKRSGRNCVAPYRNNLHPVTSNNYNLCVSEEVRNALRNDRFCLAFQPIVSSQTKQAFFHECLARIRRPDGTTLAAGSFIQAAEQMGLMREIDDHICRLAVEQLSENPELRLAVNVSGFNVGNGNWLANLRGLLQDHPKTAQRLIIEITETAALSDIREATQFVHQLRDMGCVVALDDFGAGYTSYRQLRLLPVNMVKIDGTFVQGVSTNVGNQLFVRTLVELASGFGLDTIAECVENKEDAEMLARFGVTFLQGLYFGRPELAPQSGQFDPLSMAKSQRAPLTFAGALA